MTPARRRVVTAADAARRSYVLYDSEVPANGVRAIHWSTERSSDALRDPTDTILGKLPMSPPNGATTFQIVTVPPERPDLTWDELDGFYERAFAGTEAVRGDTSRHPGMHRTPTIDYVVMLEGEVTLILDDGEVTLRPFDTLVQRGTEHAWANRSGKPASFAVVTVDLAVAGLAPVDNRHALQLAALYRLTPVEAEVALALARGARLAAIAAERGVSFNTVRTHAARLRHKMGAASQSEIVRMVLVHLGALSGADAVAK